MPVKNNTGVDVLGQAFAEPRTPPPPPPSVELVLAIRHSWAYMLLIYYKEGIISLEKKGTNSVVFTSFSSLNTLIEG